jgi:hypothetical protein
MQRDLDWGLKRLELGAWPRRIEIWVEQSDGTPCCASGECMTREAFDRLHPSQSDDVFVINAVTLGYEERP